MSLLYSAGVDYALGAGNLASDAVVAILVDSSYVANESHATLDDVSLAARVGTATFLTSKSVSGRVFDAADTTITNITAGRTVAGVVLAFWRGSDAASYPIAYLNPFSPFVTTGSDLSLIWSNGANKIFKLPGV